MLEAAIEAAAKELIDLKDNLNDWDSKVGDGDCGTTVGLVGFINFVCPMRAVLRFITS